MLLLLLACHSTPTPDDSPRPGDTGVDDSGPDDTGGDDTGSPDDTGADDTGAPDDTGATDDTGSSDDTGTPDDTGSSDDTGAPDDTGAADDTALPDDTGGPDTGEPLDPRIGMYVPDFTLPDLNPNSLRYEQPISPRDYLQQVSGWYFIHST